MNRFELLAFMQSHKLAVVGTVGVDGAPQCALVGIAITDSLEIVFDTNSDTRKHRNLVKDPRIAVTFSGPDERTLQYEGFGVPVSPFDAADEPYREAYYNIWPEGRERAKWIKIAYWRVRPRWARFSDYTCGPLIVEFYFDKPIKG